MKTKRPNRPMRMHTRHRRYARILRHLPNVWHPFNDIHGLIDLWMQAGPTQDAESSPAILPPTHPYRPKPFGSLSEDITLTIE